MQWQPDDIIGDESEANQFQIVRKLADGHIGTIWLARKLRGEREDTQCILKQIDKDIMDDSELRQHRRRQARAARIGDMFAALPNEAGFENVIKIYGRGEWQGDPYLELEYVEGISLKERLTQEKGGLPADEILDLALQLCDAIHFLETLTAGVIHQDIKAGNIMLTPRPLLTDNSVEESHQIETGQQQDKLRHRLVLIDFESALCSEDTLDGSPTDSPDPTDRRTVDIYLAAAVIAEMATGKNILDELDRKNPDEVLPKNDRLFKALCWALDPNPEKRPQSADAFREALTAPQKAGIRDRVLLYLQKKSTSKATQQLPDDMILIPEGDFQYGTEDAELEDHSGRDDPLIRHDARAKEAHLKTYYIDRTPITNRQYLEFVKQTRRRDVPYHDSALARPYNWDRKRRYPPPGLEDHPVVLVSWEDAIAYTEWRSKHDAKSLHYRLPTEKEWEKAARGTQGWLYPWGNSWDRTRCNNLEQWLGRDLEGEQIWKYFMKAVLFDLETWHKDLTKIPTPVLTMPVAQYTVGASPYGALDMAGNVWEWTADLFMEDHEYRVVRGGSWLEGPVGVRTTTRLGEWPRSRLPWIGFRCAASAPLER